MTGDVDIYNSRKAYINNNDEIYSLVGEYTCVIITESTFEYFHTMSILYSHSIIQTEIFIVYIAIFSSIT